MRILYNSVLCLSAVWMAGCQSVYSAQAGSTPKDLLEKPGSHTSQVIQVKVPPQSKKAFEISPVKTGGILMRRTDDTPWQAPKREVDTLKEQLALLRGQLGDLYTDQEKRIADKFAQVENRVTTLRQRELRDAAQDAELMALVKQKFDSIDDNIDYLRNSEIVRQSDRSALLKTMDEKFQAVEVHLAQTRASDTSELTAFKEKLATDLQELAVNIQENNNRFGSEVNDIREEKEYLLTALDQKFAQLEEENLAISENLDALKAQQDGDRERNAYLAAATPGRVPSTLAGQKAQLEQKLFVLKEQLKQAERAMIERGKDAKLLEEELQYQESIVRKGGYATPVTHITSDDIVITPPHEGGSLLSGVAADKWLDLQDYEVVVHEDNARLEDIMDRVIKRASGYAGPWQVKWKLKPGHDTVLDERFSLNVETSFQEFAEYLSTYMEGYRGFGLQFNIFNNERVLVITDE